MSDAWLYRPHPVEHPAARLVCLPFAGAAASAYRDWTRVPEWLDVAAVQLPARGWRIREAPIVGIRAMARAISEPLLEETEIPIALFGHSMGAWLALELARELTAAGSSPRMLFVSGRQAPALGNFDPPFSHLSDSEFVREIQTRYGGIPNVILQNADVLELLLPALRADVRSLELFEHRSGAAVSTPIVAYGGTSDPMVAPEDLAPWEEETSGSFAVRTFPGGHFYFQDDPSTLLDDLTSRLENSIEAVVSEETTT